MKMFYPNDIIVCNVENRYSITDIGVPCLVLKKTDEFGVVFVTPLYNKHFGTFHVHSKNFKLVSRNIEYN